MPNINNVPIAGTEEGFKDFCEHMGEAKNGLAEAELRKIYADALDLAEILLSLPPADSNKNEDNQE